MNPRKKKSQLESCSKKVARLPATGIFHRTEMRHGFIVVTDIAQHTNADLLETTQAGDPYSGVLGVIQCRQQHSRENRDDRDHHEHFDQCKLSCIAALHGVFIWLKSGVGCGGQCANIQ